jgi:hypothetical protein
MTSVRYDKVCMKGKSLYRSETLALFEMNGRDNQYSTWTGQYSAIFAVLFSECCLKLLNTTRIIYRTFQLHDRASGEPRYADESNLGYFTTSKNRI